MAKRTLLHIHMSVLMHIHMSVHMHMPMHMHMHMHMYLINKGFQVCSCVESTQTLRRIIHSR